MIPVTIVVRTTKEELMMNIAAMIDHTLLKQDATEQQIIINNSTFPTSIHRTGYYINSFIEFTIKSTIFIFHLNINC